MKETDFISYLKTLKETDWDKKATSQWRVKDVVAHLIGWERDDVEAIRKIWQTKGKPWWFKTDDYNAYNKRWVDFYSSYTPKKLIEEFEKHQQAVQKEIDYIGEDNLRQLPQLFGWLFDESDNSHYTHHYNQIKAAVGEQTFQHD